MLPPHKITSLHAREILDSRGNPTVEVDLEIDNKFIGRAAVPSGASTGAHEAVERRDIDKKNRYGGKGVLGACASVNSEIMQVVTSLPFASQSVFDEKLIALDDSKNKGRLGANAILAVSLAYAKATALLRGVPLYQSLGGERAVRLPMPLINILNGGAHANNGLSVQEFMIVPTGAKKFSEAVRAGAEVFHALKAELKDAGHSVAVGDEGGFAPTLPGSRAALDFVMKAVERAGYRPGVDMGLALDVAATELFRNDVYAIDGENLSSDEMVDYYVRLVADYPIVSIEDGMSEDDWAGWTNLTEALGGKVQLVGDDLFVTNPVRLKQGLQEKAANAILIKPNQIGTLSETLTTIDIAQANKMNVVLSHRSGETEDTTIADLAVATNAGQIKTGSMCRTDRLAKYNQLLRIEEELGSRAQFSKPDYGTHG